MMLRLGRRSLARAAAAASARRLRAPTAIPTAPSTRHFWGSDVLSWLRPDKSASPAKATEQPPAVDQASPPSAPIVAAPSEAAQAVHTEAAEPLPLDPEVHDYQETLRAGKATMRGLSHALSSSSDSSRLRELWAIAASGEPFVLEGAGLALLSESQEEDRRVGTLVMRTVPSEVFVQLRAKETSSDLSGKRFKHRTKAPWTISGLVTSDTLALGAEAADVMLLNEAAITQWTVDVFSRKKDHESVVEFFERYNRDRHLRIDALVATANGGAAVASQEAEEAPGKASERVSTFTWLRRATKLPPASYGDYILALEATKQFPQLVRVLRKDYKRRECCTSVPTLRALLAGCISEKEGDLARTALEQFSEYAPAVVIPLPQYETAIRANTISQPRTEHDLENALAIVRRMRADAGYLLNPSIWNTLFNSCIYLERPERALAVFKTYEENQIAPFQRQFLNVFRSACRFGDYDTVLDMIDFWMCTSRAASCQAGDAPSNASKVEREALNTILWEMLKGRPSTDQVQHVLRKMQDWSVQSGAILLRRAVSRLLEDDADRKTPHEQLVAAVAFWKTLPRVMVRQGFLLHLLLEHCFDKHWEGETAYLIELATAEAVVDVPQTGLTRYMEANDLSGRFVENVALGDRLVAERSTQQLGQKFFELYAMSYQRLERFDDVLALDRKLSLTRTFPKSEALATIMRDAEANR